MAATCGVGLNTAIATGVGMLGDVHGGAGEQFVELLTEIVDAAWRAEPTWTPRPGASWPPGGPGTRYVPGFGHRFHPVDPRRDPLLVPGRATPSGTAWSPGDYLRAALRRGGRSCGRCR